MKPEEKQLDCIDPIPARLLCTAVPICKTDQYYQDFHGSPSRSRKFVSKSDLLAEETIILIPNGGITRWCMRCSADTLWPGKFFSAEPPAIVGCWSVVMQFSTRARLWFHCLLLLLAPAAAVLNYQSKLWLFIQPEHAIRTLSPSTAFIVTATAFLNMAGHILHHLPKCLKLVQLLPVSAAYSHVSCTLHRGLWLVSGSFSYGRGRLCPLVDSPLWKCVRGPPSFHLSSPWERGGNEATNRSGWMK